MGFVSRYQSHAADQEGYVNYTVADDQTWAFLYQRQIALLPNRALPEYIQGLELLKLSSAKVPQIPDINRALKQYSNWQVVPVAAAISQKKFFSLLANRCFPVATFIRSSEDMGYITEPDVFHEVFGHIPLLTQIHYASFMEHYAKIALSYPESDWHLFLRLYWFTIEFGLVQTLEGMRIYGAGILSSGDEIQTCLTSSSSYQVYFNVLAALATPYRIDQIQKLYFVLPKFAYLQELLDLDYAKIFAQVREQGMFLPLYTQKELNTDFEC